MTPLEIYGWVCGIFGASVALPQLIRILVARTSAGLSLLSWQLNGGSLIAWTAHGLISQRQNLIWTNGFLGACMMGVLILIIADRKLSWVRSLTPALSLSIVMIVIELSAGELAFGLVAAVPGAIAWSAQLKDVLERPDLSGISVVTLVMSVVQQGMWIVWASLAGDRAVLVVASLIGAIAAATLAAYIGRTHGWLRQRVS